MPCLRSQLAPRCTSTLARCSWRGRAVPCERLFATRVTPLGHCCVFNSRYYSEDYEKKPRYLDIIGEDYGLSVLVRENLDDFASIRRPSAGMEVQVLLFDGSDYPILEGGGVRMYPVEQNVSAFISISVRAQYPAEEALAGCRASSAAGQRSSAWCLARCRRRTLLAVCGCRTHAFPPDPWDRSHVCSLTHLSCLNKHREKFIYYYPVGYAGGGLQAEVQNGQNCDECAPDCTRLVYTARVTATRYFCTNTSARKIFLNAFTKDAALVNSTVIRLYFSSEHQQLYVIAPNRPWFEIFATVSSQWASILGAALLAASEAVFFATVRWAHHFCRRGRTIGCFKAGPR